MSIEPSHSDLDFERSLLEAARREEPPSPADTARAWSRFAASGGQLAASVAHGAGRAWLSSANLGWLATGLVAGSMATAALMPARDAAPEPAASAVEQAPEAAASAAQRAPQLAHEPALAPGASPPASVHPESVPPAAPHSAGRAIEGARSLGSERAADAAPPRGARARAAMKQRSARAAAPGLEAEVRALDAIQRAVSEGRPGDALDAVDVFHREFPRAQLAADAEGLAIEALLARGDTAAAAERAKRFLQRYPSDPHAPRFAPLTGDGG